jgi:hypothetical protein
LVRIVRVVEEERAGGRWIETMGQGQERASGEERGQPVGREQDQARIRGQGGVASSEGALF